MALIPRILHRTVPAETTEEVEEFWAAAERLHPDWHLVTHRDPLDPTRWPETGPHWPRCTSGAQLAGLIRLEALWHHGGVYIDSDVELYRPLDCLLACEAFAAWEDALCVPDAVLGAMPAHPAIRACLDLAVERVAAGEGAWASGPGVTTEVLVDRDDVVTIPPASFYPYHYQAKHLRSARPGAHDPWCFGAHHWAHSWAGR